MIVKADIDLAYIATGAGRPSTAWTESAPRVQAPTLLVTGDVDVLVGEASRAVIAAMDRPNLEVVVIPDAGHYVRHQQGEAFHAVVDPWLRSHLQL